MMNRPQDSLIATFVITVWVTWGLFRLARGGVVGMVGGVVLQLSRNVVLPLAEIDIQAVRASGPGGQHVNKTSSAAHLFFDIRASSLPDFYKGRLLALADQRITQEGVIVLKAQTYRSLERNREEVLERLANLIREAVKTEKARRATRPSRTARAKRVDSKKKQGKVKSLRGRVRPE